MNSECHHKLLRFSYPRSWLISSRMHNSLPVCIPVWTFILRHGVVLVLMLGCFDQFFSKHWTVKWIHDVGFHFDAEVACKCNLFHNSLLQSAIIYIPAPPDWRLPTLSIFSLTTSLSILAQLVCIIKFEETRITNTIRLPIAIENLTACRYRWDFLRTQVQCGKITINCLNKCDGLGVHFFPPMIFRNFPLASRCIPAGLTGGADITPENDFGYFPIKNILNWQILM